MLKTKKIALPNPVSFKKLWKTKKATENIDITLLMAVKDYWTKTHKPQWNVTWKDLADRVFSEYIRLKNADKDWMCTCVTCWAKMKWTDIQNWHFITRWNMMYRFSTANCNCQCYKCNCILNGNYQQYTMYMINKYWIQTVRRMLDDKRIKNIKQYEYEEIIIWWYKEIQVLKGKIK